METGTCGNDVATCFTPCMERVQKSTLENNKKSNEDGAICEERWSERERVREGEGERRRRNFPSSSLPERDQFHEITKLSMNTELTTLRYSYRHYVDFLANIIIYRRVARIGESVLVRRGFISKYLC